MRLATDQRFDPCRAQTFHLSLLLIPKDLSQSIQHFIPRSPFINTKSAAAKPKCPPHPCHSNLLAPVAAPSSPAQPAPDLLAAVWRQTRVTPPAALQETSGQPLSSPAHMVPSQTKNVRWDRCGIPARRPNPHFSAAVRRIHVELAVAAIISRRRFYLQTRASQIRFWERRGAVRLRQRRLL